MDFDFDTSPSNDAQNNNQSQPSGEQKMTNLDDILNMDFQPLADQNPNQNQPEQKNSSQNDQLNMEFLNNNINPSFSPSIDEEEQKRISDRQKEADERKQKINEKMKK